MHASGDAPGGSDGKSENLLRNASASPITADDMADAKKFAKLDSEAKQEFQGRRLIAVLTDERDLRRLEVIDLKAQIGKSNSRIEELHKVEIELSALKVQHRWKRVSNGMIGALAIIASGLISAYPSNATEGFGCFTAQQLFAIGWCISIVAGGWLILKGVFDV